MVKDRLCHVAINALHEERSRRGHRAVAFVVWRVHLRVGDRPDHIYNRCGESAERCDGTLSILHRTGVAQHCEDDELAVMLCGYERHRGRWHDVCDCG